jgi:hypothetical protein
MTPSAVSLNWCAFYIPAWLVEHGFLVIANQKFIGPGSDHPSQQPVQERTDE